MSSKPNGMIICAVCVYKRAQCSDNKAVKHSSENGHEKHYCLPVNCLFRLLGRIMSIKCINIHNTKQPSSSLDLTLNTLWTQLAHLNLQAEAKTESSPPSTKKEKKKG